MRILSVLTLLVALTGCAAFSDEAPGSADGVQVATAFYPLQYVAQRVAGDLAGVENLTQPGKEPHDLELTVAETAAVADADLVIVVNVLSLPLHPVAAAVVARVLRGRAVRLGHPEPAHHQHPLSLGCVAGQPSRDHGRAGPF